MAWTPQSDEDQIWQEQTPEKAASLPPVPETDPDPSDWVQQTGGLSTMTELEYQATITAIQAAEEAKGYRDETKMWAEAGSTEYADIVIRHEDIIVRHEDIIERQGDVIEREAHVVQMEANIQGAEEATAADRVQTGLDAAQTAADRAVTESNATATAADRSAVAADRVLVEGARDDAQAAQTAAESARDTAVANAGYAESYAESAQSNANSSEAARDAAIAARDTAQGYATTAQSAMAAAAGYRNEAQGFRNEAETFATDSEAIYNSFMALDPVPEAPSDGDTYGRKNGTWVKAAGAAQIQDAAPATGDVGTFWWSSLTGQLAIRYNDDGGQVWVGLNGSLSAAVVIGDNEPSNAYHGMLWWESDTGALLIRYNDGDTEQWVSAFGATSYDLYSASETLTNKVWIDGKPIYRKVVDLGTLPNSATTKVVAHGITGISTVTSITGIMQTTGFQMPLPYLHPTNITASVGIYMDPTSISAVCGADRSAYIARVYVEYTKV